MQGLSVPLADWREKASDSLAAHLLFRASGVMALLRRARRGSSQAINADRARIGDVVLAGAGPGDPELLTLKAIKALESADVILYDQLVSDEVLALVPRRAQRIGVGKKGYGPTCRQSDINMLMVAFARAGRRVVREALPPVE